MAREDAGGVVVLRPAARRAGALAGAAMGPDGIDPEAFLRLVAPCRGQISAVLAAEAAPGRVVVLKGKWRSHMDMPLRGPLEFRYSQKRRAVATS